MRRIVQRSTSLRERAQHHRVQDARYMSLVDFAQHGAFATTKIRGRFFKRERANGDESRSAAKKPRN
jgi:hypothetical protein